MKVRASRLGSIFYVRWGKKRQNKNKLPLNFEFEFEPEKVKEVKKDE
jgi:hypothetical protein